MTEREYNPAGWGTKDLTTFLDLVRNNQCATFANHRDAVAVLERIDGAFMRIGLGAAMKGCI
jgi:hypothetical protein